MKSTTYLIPIEIVLEHCTGCTHCVTECPTEAIRVRLGKVQIDNARCIACGRCIDACKFDALRPKSDPFSSKNRFEYKVAILSSPFAAQFPEYFGYHNIKKSLRNIGFDEVVDEAELSGILFSLIRRYVREHPENRPIIAASCPAIVRLIQVHFPSLVDNILRIESAMGILAHFYRKVLPGRLNLPDDRIGIFLIASCIAQVISVHQPEGVHSRLHDGAMAASDVYNRIWASHPQPGAKEPLLRGHRRAVSGLSTEDLEKNEIKTLSVSGIKNVIKILSRIENQQIEKFDLVIPWSCVNGCVGGLYNVENPFIATARILHSSREKDPREFDPEYFQKLYSQKMFDIRPLEPRPATGLDSDIKTAIVKMKQVREIENRLPGLNCSACGSPSCRALAEDIVLGKATFEDCLVQMRRKVGNRETGNN